MSATSSTRDNDEDEIVEEEREVESTGSTEINDYYCTRPITGTAHPAHQPIYICESCKLLPASDGHDAGEKAGEEGDKENTPNTDNNNDANAEIEPLPSCICQCCASICHAGHDVYYVGVGPCTCDCVAMVTASTSASGGGSCGHECRLAEHSEREARRLGFGSTTSSNGTSGNRKLNDPIPLKIPPVATLLHVASMMDGVGDGGEMEVKVPQDSMGMPHEGEEKIDQWLSELCIECNASMGGYTYGSFTIPGLTSANNNEKANDVDAVKGGDALCKDLIRQAEILTDHSHDTFWMPIDDNDNDDNRNNSQQQTQWCDLELLAREIYRHHVQSYNLNATEGSGARDAGNGGGGGGAEWWVQVKPAGSTRAPVDLHYDKDEVLAETFGLGSFPTLSTVTYLTGVGNSNTTHPNYGGSNTNNDNAPTVIFPHTYNDDETQPIPMMLLSHAVKGKHLVFDGRLLHGAPAHPALRWGYNGDTGVANDGNENTRSNVEEHISRSSSLRVTFLVNIWRSGRPAAVQILPEEIRSKIRSVSPVDSSSSSLRSMLPLGFEKRHVSQHHVVSAKGKEKIILPFVSHGATWIGGDEEEGEDSENNDDNVSDGEEVLEQEAVDHDDGDKEEDEDEDEDDEELVLVLPPFASLEYLVDPSDTILFSFESGNEARLIREGVVDDMDEQEACKWKKYLSENNESSIDEHEIAEGE